MPGFSSSRGPLYSPKPRKWTSKAARFMGGFSAGLVLLVLFLLHRSTSSRGKDSSSSKVGSGASGDSVVDGSQLLAEQQESHVSKHSHGALAGVVERPKPPGWPFDPMDYPKPKTFFDISIDGKPAGRIVFELFTKQAPKLAENFRALCTGERGSIPLGGLAGDGGPRLHYKGANFYRVIKGFICQTGIYTSSIYGRAIEDEPLAMRLKHNKAPRAAENFRALCTGEKGHAMVDGNQGPRLHYKGAEFYRVIDQFICQTGIETPSIYGGAFDDDPMALDLRHDKKGLLSAANAGPNTTTTHFSIVVAPAPHLNGHYPIFGQVVQGMDVVDRINALAKPSGSKDERPRLPVVVSNCGELICDENNACKEITLQER